TMSGVTPRRFRHSDSTANSAGGTTVEMMAAVMPPSPMPSRPRRPASSAAYSSEVRPLIVSSRQWPRRTSPSYTPSTVLVLPTSTTSSIRKPCGGGMLVMWARTVNRLAHRAENARRSTGRLRALAAPPSGRAQRGPPRIERGLVRRRRPRARAPGRVGEAHAAPVVELERRAGEARQRAVGAEDLSRHPQVATAHDPPREVACVRLDLGKLGHGRVIL